VNLAQRHYQAAMDGDEEPWEVLSEMPREEGSHDLVTTRVSSPSFEPIPAAKLGGGAGRQLPAQPRAAADPHYYSGWVAYVVVTLLIAAGAIAVLVWTW
jgi:hypothetical protein